MPNNRPSGIFMYGYPAAGKTTFCKKFIKENPEVVYISADAIREEKYGSQDTYGNPIEMYGWILDKMKETLDAGKDFIYDGTNLYKEYRTDFLDALSERNWNKFCLRINTTKDKCIANHAKRGRNITQEELNHYFDINEPPTMEEGWDEIEDVSYMYGHKRIYIASPFFKENNRENALKATEILRQRGQEVYLPLEHKIINAWDYPNYQWGKMVFDNDVKAINNCDIVVVLSYGRESTAGTNWEAGYAWGIGKNVIVVEMPEVKLMSLMLANGRIATLKGIDALKTYNFKKLPKLEDREMEQK